MVILAVNALAVNVLAVNRVFRTLFSGFTVYASLGGFLVFYSLKPALRAFRGPAQAPAEPSRLRDRARGEPPLVRGLQRSPGGIQSQRKRRHGRLLADAVFHRVLVSQV